MMMMVRPAETVANLGKRKGGRRPTLSLVPPRPRFLDGRITGQIATRDLQTPSERRGEEEEGEALGGAQSCRVPRSIAGRRGSRLAAASVQYLYCVGM